MCPLLALSLHNLPQFQALQSIGPCPGSFKAKLWFLNFCPQTQEYTLQICYMLPRFGVSGPKPNITCQPPWHWLVHWYTAPHRHGISCPFKTCSSHQPQMQTVSGTPQECWTERSGLLHHFLDAIVYNSRIIITYLTHPRGQSFSLNCLLFFFFFFKVGFFFFLTTGTTSVLVHWISHLAVTHVTQEPGHSKDRFDMVTFLL